MKKFKTMIIAAAAAMSMSCSGFLDSFPPYAVDINVSVNDSSRSSHPISITRKSGHSTSSRAIPKPAEAEGTTEWKPYSAKTSRPMRQT